MEEQIETAESGSLLESKSSLNLKSSLKTRNKTNAKGGEVGDVVVKHRLQPGLMSLIPAAGRASSEAMM